jgi:hypothetical protein
LFLAKDLLADALKTPLELIGESTENSALCHFWAQISLVGKTEKLRELRLHCFTAGFSLAPFGGSRPLFILVLS